MTAAATLLTHAVETQDPVILLALSRAICADPDCAACAAWSKADDETLAVSA